MADELLEELDALAEKRGTSRNRLIVEACEQLVSAIMHRLPGALQRLRRYRPGEVVLSSPVAELPLLAALLAGPLCGVRTHRSSGTPPTREQTWRCTRHVIGHH